jgi:hypothetical protein
MSTGAQKVELKMPTTVARELFYMLEHTVHHMAIIKMAVVNENLNIDIPENFGVANSTIQYQKSVHSKLNS